MKKFITTLIVVFGLGMAAPAAAPAYLHVDNATDFSRFFWNDAYTNHGYYTWHYRRDYRRISDDRVDILGQGWRLGVYGCRWNIVRGSDTSKWTEWHPNSSFSPGCGGV